MLRTVCHSVFNAKQKHLLQTRSASWFLAAGWKKVVSTDLEWLHMGKVGAEGDAVSISVSKRPPGLLVPSLEWGYDSESYTKEREETDTEIKGSGGCKRLRLAVGGAKHRCESLWSVSNDSGTLEITKRFKFNISESGMVALKPPVRWTSWNVCSVWLARI